MSLQVAKDTRFESDRRRYYLFNEDHHRNPSDYKPLNLAEMIPDFPGDNIEMAWFSGGSRTFRVPGNHYDSHYGLPSFAARPKVYVALKNNPLDVYGFGERRLISSRAKKLMVDADPEAFDCVECETLTRKGLEVEPYWLIDVGRIVSTFDEENSVFERAKGEDCRTGEPNDAPHFSGIYDIRMSPDMPKHLAFAFDRYSSRIVLDQTIVDAWRTEKLTGAEFVPLQPPTPKEAKSKSPPWAPYWWPLYEAHAGRDQSS